MTFLIGFWTLPLLNVLINVFNNDNKLNSWWIETFFFFFLYILFKIYVCYKVLKNHFCLNFRSLIVTDQSVVGPYPLKGKTRNILDFFFFILTVYFDIWIGYLLKQLNIKIEILHFCTNKFILFVFDITLNEWTFLWAKYI